LKVTRYDRGRFKKKAVKTDEGFLRTDAIVTRTGVFYYRNPDGSTRRELRHPDDILALDSIESMKMIPITNDHPLEGLVTADTAKKLQVGSTGENIRPDGNDVIAPIVVTDETAVNDVENGKQELSLGYELELVDEQGNYDGEDYDFRQTNVKYNHLAIVDSARAGSRARIHMDSAEEIDKPDSNNDDDVPNNKPDKGGNMSKYRKDGIEYDAAQEVVNHIATLDTKIADLEQANSDVKGELDTIRAERDSLKEELDKLKETNTDEAIAKAVAARRDLESKASKVLSEDDMKDLIGKSDKEVQIAVIKSVSPDANLDDETDAYISGRFDSAVENSESRKKNNADNAQKVNQRGDDDDEDVVGKARQDMIDDMTGKKKPDTE